MSMARVQPLQLNKAQESTMRNLSSMVSAMAPWSNWNTTDSNPCLWSGVTCSVPSKRPGSSAVVLHLSMSRFGLSNSTILACLCSLDTLESLDLSQNRFTDLPRQFSSCPLGARLRTLNLSYAQLPGPLGDFTRFRKLEVLDFSFSLLSGNVNKQLSSLPRLRSLNLSSNNLDGGLPTNMVHSLKELVLSGNSFSGLIPSGITMNTEMLDLSTISLVLLGTAHLVVVVAAGEELVGVSSSRSPLADRTPSRTPDTESWSLPCPPSCIQQGRRTTQPWREASIPAMGLGLERRKSAPSGSAPTTVGPGLVLGRKMPPSTRSRAFDANAHESLDAAARPWMTSPSSAGGVQFTTLLVVHHLSSSTPSRGNSLGNKADPSWIQADQRAGGVAEVGSMWGSA
ncbi:Receptor-like protein kinase 2 [Hordeum vulgare]|nr:Receptor-like protein kinase 2 [Hordeum vulgare]